MVDGDSSRPRRRSRRRARIVEPNRVATWQAVKAACGAVIRHPGAFFKASWIWILIIWGVSAAFIYSTGAQAHWRPSTMLAGFHDARQQVYSGGLRLVIYDVLIAPFAVGWLRHVLLGSPMTSFATLRFGAREMRFIWYTISSSVVLLLVFAAAFAVPLIAGAGPFLIWKSMSASPIPAKPLIAAMAVLAAAIGAIVALAIGARILLWAPLSALGVKGNLIARSWRLSRGNALRILTGGLLITILFVLPMILLSGSIGLLVMATRDVYPAIGLALLMPILILAQLAALSGFLCHATAQIGGFQLPLRAEAQPSDELAPEPQAV